MITWLPIAMNAWKERSPQNVTLPGSDRAPKWMISTSFVSDYCAVLAWLTVVVIFYKQRKRFMVNFSLTRSTLKHWSLQDAHACHPVLQRWTIEKVYNSSKSNLKENKAWSSSIKWPNNQVHLTAMTYNLMRVFEEISKMQNPTLIHPADKK